MFSIRKPLLRGVSTFPSSSHPIPFKPILHFSSPSDYPMLVCTFSHIRPRLFLTTSSYSHSPLVSISVQYRTRTTIHFFFLFCVLFASPTLLHVLCRRFQFRLTNILLCTFAMPYIYASRLGKLRYHRAFSVTFPFVSYSS